MQLDTFVMSALMAFVFLGFGVYVFYMFATPNEKLRQLTASWDIEELSHLHKIHGLDAETELSKVLGMNIKREFNLYDYDDPSLDDAPKFSPNRQVHHSDLV